MLTQLKTANVVMIVAAGSMLLAACGGSSGIADVPADDALTGVDERAEYVTPVGIAECSINDIKKRIDFDMRDYYVYYDQVPLVDSADLETPEDFIRALRVDPDIYSFVADEEEQGALFEEGMTSGYGIRFNPASDEVVRFREILVGSPADRAGVQRGDELIRLNDRLISNFNNDELRNALGNQLPITLQIRTSDEAPRELVLEQETYRWRTARSYVFRSDGLPTVGLLQVRSFLETTVEEIDESITALRESGIDDLIVDFRYNPGGRTRVAERLAAQIVGPSIDGQPFLVRRWNDKYSENDSTSTLESAEPALALPRIIVLLTDRSASASEAMVNGLEPYIDVIVIGGVTRGKIFTSNSRNYCGRSINAMRSERTNSVGVSVLGGIQPDCEVTDDWVEPVSSSRDPLTSAALDYIVTGVCPDIAIADSKLANRDRTRGPSFQGMSELLETPLDLID